MSIEAVQVSPRQMTWLRRRRALLRVWRELRHDRSGFTGLLLLVFFGVVAAAAPLIADRSELLAAAGRNNPDLAAPSAKFLLGTDDIGRSVLSQLVWGSRVSLFIGLLATVVAVVIGSTVGLISGYVKGRVGSLLLAIDDFFWWCHFYRWQLCSQLFLGDLQ